MAPPSLGLYNESILNLEALIQVRAILGGGGRIAAATAETRPNLVRKPPTVYHTHNKRLSI